MALIGAEVAAEVAKPVVKYAILGAAIGLPIIAAVICWYGWTAAASQRDLYKHDRDAAAGANETLQHTMADLRKNQALVNAATAKELDRMRKQAETVSELKKEQHNEQGSGDLAGPYFDDLADRLRALDAQGTAGGAVAH